MSGIELVKKEYPHGTRARYAANRCRCDDCRKANTTYATMRARAVRNGDTAKLVSAERARQHVLELSTKGIGKRAVADASDVAVSVINGIRRGTHKQITERTERRILAVDEGARLDGALVKKSEITKPLRALLSVLPKMEIARRLGSVSKTPALQLTGRRVTARTAMKVQRLAKQVLDADVTCKACDLSHSESSRFAHLAACDVTELRELPTTWPCLYGGSAGLELLRSDLSRLGITAPNLTAAPALYFPELGRKVGGAA